MPATFFGGKSTDPPVLVHGDQGKNYPNTPGLILTTCQRDLIEAQVNLLRAMLDHQSARVDFEAVQIAAPQGSAEVGLDRANVVLMPLNTPAGIFRR